MKTYQSHKTVLAAQITHVDLLTGHQAGALLTLAPDSPNHTAEIVTVDDDWLTRHAHKVDIEGGYLLRYPDGYMSWCPVAVFERDYLTDDNRLDGGEAQGLPVSGYKPTQPQWAIDAVNGFKELEERTLRHAESLQGAAIDNRMMAIGKTQAQLAFMALNRAIFQPQRVSLPEDDGQTVLAFESDAKA